MRMKAPMRKQGENMASIPSSPTCSCTETRRRREAHRIHPRLAPGGLYWGPIPRLAPARRYDAKPRIASAAAATVASISASVWAAEKKSASYWLHGM